MANKVLEQGIVLAKQLKKYFMAHDDIEQFSIKLDPKEGNLLQQNEDGLYYGIKPPANKENLYVDSVNGVDQDPEKVEGAGSRSQPLRTFKYAQGLAIPGTTRKIFLKEQQTHHIDEIVRVVFGGLTISSYGDEKDRLTREIGDEFQIDRELVRLGKQAKLQFDAAYITEYPKGNFERDRVDFRMLRIYANTLVAFRGIGFVVNLSAFNQHLRNKTGNLNVTDPTLIYLDGSSIEMSNITLESLGEIGFTYENVSSSPVDNLAKTNEYKLYALSLLGCTNAGGQIGVRNINEFTALTAKMNVIGDYGWNVGLPSTLSLAMKNANCINPNELYKRIVKLTSYTQKSGDQLILAPLIDLNPTLLLRDPNLVYPQ